MIQSALAILAGIVVLTVTSFAIEWVTDPVLAGPVLPQRAGKRSDVASRRPKTDNVCVHDLMCGIPADMSRRGWHEVQEVRHAVVMGVIQMALTTLAMIEFRHKALVWFWIAGIAVTVPAAWCGGISTTTWARRPAK